MTRQPQYLKPEGLAVPLGLYSNASRIDGPVTLLFIAGQVAVDQEGNLVGEGDFAAQMRQVFRNLGLALASAGATFPSVAKLTTYLTRADDIEAFYATRSQLFPTLFPDGAYPPNTLIVVERLVRGEFLIEVDAIAAVSR